MHEACRWKWIDVAQLMQLDGRGLIARSCTKDAPMRAGAVAVEQTPTLGRFGSNETMLIERPTMPRAGLKAVRQWFDTQSAD